MLKPRSNSTESIGQPIYKQLKEKIISGALPGGTALRQDDIAAEFGTSKVPVREILRQLETEGLVEFHQSRGAFVKQLSNQDILHMLDIRIALERRALELSIPKMTEEHLRQAEEALNIAKVEDDNQTWSVMNRHFHRCLYAPCQNVQLLKKIEEVSNRMGPYIRLNITEASRSERLKREHIEILNACRNRDIPQALRLLNSHIETTQKEVAAYMRKNPMQVNNS